MDTVEAIRLIALRDVIRGGADYNTRYLHRWFSKTFSTPYAVVQNMDPNELLQAFFEEKFENMDETEREEQRLALLEGEEERNAKEAQAAQEKAQEEDLVRMSKAANEASMEKMSTPVPLAELGPLPENTKMEFIEDAEMERLAAGGFANETRSRTPII